MFVTMEMRWVILALASLIWVQTDAQGTSIFACFRFSANLLKIQLSVSIKISHCYYKIIVHIILFKADQLFCACATVHARFQKVLSEGVQL